MSLFDELIAQGALPGSIPANYETMPFNPYAQSTPASPESAATPSILDLVQAGPPQPKALPPPEGLDSLPALALLRFAAQISQPKARGQSTVGKFMQSAADAGGYFMGEKARMEDRGVQKELQKQQLAKGEQEVENTRLTGIERRQGIINEEQKAPLQIENLKRALENAKSDAEIKNLQIKAAQLKERYAEDLAKAELAEKQGKDPESRARAARDQAAANLAQRQADELIKLAEIRARERYKPDTVALDPPTDGGPQLVLDKRTGASYRMPMHPAAARDFAIQQAAAHAQMTGMDRAAQQAEEKRIYQDLIRGNMPKNLGSDPDASPTNPQGEASPTPSPTTPQVDQKAIIEARIESLKTPNNLRYNNKLQKYFLNGQEVPNEQAARILARMKGGSATPTPQVPAATPSSPFNGGA